MTEYNVTKRDGSIVPFDVEKIHKAVEWAAEGLDVSVSEVELKQKLALYNNINTSDLQKILIQSAAELISPFQPDYQFMAARMLLMDIRKTAYGQYHPISIKEQIHKHKSRYDSLLWESYTDADYDALEKIIDHDRDMLIAYAGMSQMASKYLLQDRTTKKVFESPQMLYMLVMMTLFAKEKNRLEWISRGYDALSRMKFSLPTPIMAGIRTKVRQGASCVKIECDDSLESISEVAKAIISYISRKAGIGLGIGRIRAEHSPIRGGDTKHTGLVPFIKMFQAAVKSCSQGGVRGGAATLFYPLWHLDVEQLLVLKNGMGGDDVRARHLDYGVQINGFLYERLKKGEKITLFSPHEVKDLYEAFFADQELFAKLYVQYENDPSIRKSSIKAVDLFNILQNERSGTGRIYIENVDNQNKHSAFIPTVAPVRQSNLCVEIGLPTKPLTQDAGEIALCVLSAINVGALESLHELEGIAEIVVRLLDNLIDYQEYPMKQAEIPTKARRSLGIGVNNFAYYLAKNGVDYLNPKAIAMTDELFEHIQFYLLKASNNLAREKGACEWFNETKYSQGILPIDTCSENLPRICNRELSLDWETLRASIVAFGLRNSTLTAQMPSETSSQITNATNGIETPRSMITVKQSKDGAFSQLVPEVEKLGLMYTSPWHENFNTANAKLVAMMQRYIDQSISYNEYYDAFSQPGGMLSNEKLLRHMIFCHQLGIKTMYYHNAKPSATDDQSALVDTNACGDGGCVI